MNHLANCSPQSDAKQSGLTWTTTGRRGIILHFATVALALIAQHQPAIARDAFDLRAELTQASRSRYYQPATADQLRDIEALFLRTLRAADDASLAAEWQSVGMQLLRAEHRGEPVWVIRESPRRPRGWGFYLVYPRRLPGIVLQAPHSFSDRMTRDIALRLDEQGAFSAVAWNTVPRRSVDVAHDSDHPFSAFTQAVVRAFPTVLVIQVHGFAQEKRKSDAGRVADLIVSNGNQHPEPFVRKTATLMQAYPSAFGRTLLYPFSVGELGATTNVQADLLRQHGSQRFIHFEMSQPLRLRMAGDPHVRQLFLKKLSEGAD